MISEGSCDTGDKRLRILLKYKSTGLFTHFIVHQGLYKSKCPYPTCYSMWTEFPKAQRRLNSAQHGDYI